MRTRAIWIGVVLILCTCGLAVSQALSLERWVDSSRLAAEPVLAQETRPPASPVLRSRFGRVVPPGWSAPRLVEEPARSDRGVVDAPGAPERACCGRGAAARGRAVAGRGSKRGHGPGPSRWRRR